MKRDQRQGQAWAWFILLSLAAAALSAARDAPPGVTSSLPRGHAHNDYEHSRPLLDALDHGFTSVEADIYLIDGALLVAHDRDRTHPSRTLQSLYLDPLRERVKRAGQAARSNRHDFILLVDIKSEADSTYRVLEQVLTNYHDILTVFRPDQTELKAVTVILSGNRPRSLVAAQSARHVGIDGRLADLSTNFSHHLIPLISDNWTQHFTWRGEGPLPSSEKRRLDEVVAAAHERGCRIRFWAIPDRPVSWEILRNARVDLLNTDDLDGMQKFLANPPK